MRKVQEARNPRSHRGEEVPHCGSRRWCRARKLFLSLSTEDMRTVLEEAPEPNLSTLLRSIGLQPRSRKAPQLLRSRMARATDQQLHYVTWMLAATPLDTLAEVLRLTDEAVGDDGEGPDIDLYTTLRDGGLTGWAQEWSPAILRLALEAMWDRAMFGADERDELMAMLEEPTTLAATDPSGAEELPSGMKNAEHDVVTELRQPMPTGLARSDERRGDLGWLLERAVTTALAPNASKTGVQAQRRGIEWLIGLDPGSAPCWLTYGRVVAAGDPARSHLKPRSPGARQNFLAGRIEGLAEVGDHGRLLEVVAGDVDMVEGLLAAPPTPHLVAGVIEAHLSQPREAARLLALVRQPFDGWQQSVRRIRAEALELVDTGADAEAEVLLRSVEDRLLRWAARPSDAEQELSAEAAATTVLRARGRRRRRDFVGASCLLAEIDQGDLDDDGRVAAALETAMATAEISGIEHLVFPPDCERARMAERLERARPHFELVLGADPAQLEANLLLGMNAYCGEDDPATSRHLGMVADRLREAPECQALARAVAFHRALARLRQLEAGTDEGAYHDMVSAVDDGYAPSEGELISAAVALEAHGSPHAGDFLVRVVALAPSAAVMVGLVAERARSGDTTAAAIAERMGAEIERRVLERFKLLDAALAGAEERGDPAAVDRLVGLVDDVVARANRRSLDDRWAHVLETGETLRAVLDPAQADAIRMEVLRRAGRLDEARAIATSLFYRAAAGSLRSFDVAELLEVLGELGLPEDQRNEMARLVNDEPAMSEGGAPTDSRVVLFVGGNETQEQYRANLDAEINERYGDGVKVEWFFSGWSSNWPKVAEAVEARLQCKPDAVVLMTFVRTNLGRWVRRTAGEHGVPWISCTGHGRASIARSIEGALRVASRVVHEVGSH